ncbi:MAG: protein translocase subunit SecD, partial [Chlamydiia bacterium]|nr:protein translocase subunit SecD [Chlamydiia bacterium]
LTSEGFIGYSGESLGTSSAFAKDLIFRLPNYYDNFLMATRENFSVKGDKRFAVLDFSDVEQRLLTLNRIEDAQQEDLLKWRDQYRAAQVDMNSTTKLSVPPPTKNPFWENLKLSARKYFRGDDRKILKWGLDLSGGKTVRIALRDQNNRLVTSQDELNQAVNELYNRINKMGVAERTIRVEGSTIILDFPGSQGLSAADLIKGSSMTFHIVNMKFAPSNGDLSDSINTFLQGVWNEAVVTNRRDAESVKEIAWKHLGGVLANGEQTFPRSEAANTLYENGLVVANPFEDKVSAAFDDRVSSVALLRGDDISQWHGQTHPLVIVFHNYALEGANLDNIQVGYDPSKGNILHFSVKNSYEHSSGSPRDDFYAWTSQFAHDRIQGTLKEKYSRGMGWPMAVILNDAVISMPTLEAPLRDGGMISGRFTQSEINQLAADLKAGSLTYTPKIISEYNVSPELGKEERHKGIIASLVGISAVVAIMVGYYRFAGVVASCALFFNLLIIWGVLQNLGAALTLPGIAGIVLTIGMAVDANVLVFERIREEFMHSKRIVTALQTGYKKAFSAIIDSNLTTILAAVILIQFDAGPIRGFAVVLIVGILSSMFTGLFMTRYYFTGWVANPEHKELKMSHWIGETTFDFLKYARPAFIATVVAILLGVGFLSSQSTTILGMDFTGGYSLNAVFKEQGEDVNYRKTALDALVEAGAPARSVLVQQLSRSNQLRIQLGTAMEESGHPFYNLPEKESEGTFEYRFQSNPRIQWVVQALEKGGLEFPQSQLKQMDENWTSMSGQFSSAMRNNAI